ncbi:MAG: MarR family winged helix-turn-helix transcriptional regulator [Saccharospirillum sp.]
MSDINTMPGHLIRRFQQAAVAIFHTEVGRLGYDLTPVQYAALAELREHPGIDQITLAGLIAYDRTTIGGVVDRLVQKGWLARAISPKDRRARVLHLTEEGHLALAQIRPAVENAQAIMLKGLSEEESKVFQRLLIQATSAINGLSRAPLKKIE